MLRGEETLAEAGVPAAGGVVDLRVGDGGGMPGAGADSTPSIFAPGGSAPSIFAPADSPPSIFAPADSIFAAAQPDGAGGGDVEEGLAGAVGGLLGQVSGHESRIEGAVLRLRAVHGMAHGPASERQVDAEICPTYAQCVHVKVESVGLLT